MGYLIAIVNCLTLAIIFYMSLSLGKRLFYKGIRFTPHYKKALKIAESLNDNKTFKLDKKDISLLTTVNFIIKEKYNNSFDVHISTINDTTFLMKRQIPE